MSRFIQRELTKGDLSKYNRGTDHEKISTFLSIDDSFKRQPTASGLTWDAERKKELDEKRQKFYNAMSEAIQEDKEGEYSSLIHKKENISGLDDQGLINKALVDDLREFRHDELLNLEEAIKNARVPTDDLFGIKRRFCTVCEQGCNGYAPSTMMVPQAGEFPTFCKNCKCPAHFHQICIDPKDIVFPQELKNSLRNHNIGAKDLNFNSVMLAFQVRDQHSRQQNTSELMTILKEEGLEIISIAHRFLEIEEAIYFKSRMMQQTEFNVMQALGIHKTYGKENEIRRDGQIGSAFIGKQGASDPYLMNKHADSKEARMIQMATKSIVEYPREHMEHIPGVRTIKGYPQNGTANLTSSNLAGQHLGGETINQRETIIRPGEPSIARTSNVSNMDDNAELNAMIEESMSLIRRDGMAPSSKDKTFKVKKSNKNGNQIKSKMRGTVEELTEEMQEIILAQNIEKDPLLQELITKEVLIIAVSSATFQNLYIQIKEQVMPKIQVFLPPYEMPLLYLSSNKMYALEDCIVFFPALFKLTKSIVVSEPLSSAGIIGQKPGSEMTSDIHLTLRGKKDDMNPDMAEKLKSLMNDSVAELDEDLDDQTHYKSRGTLKIKTSAKLKQLIIQRDTLRKTQQMQSLMMSQKTQGDSSIFEASDSNWAERARVREKLAKKKNKLLSQHNKMLFNFGVLHDFFNYSAMTIQSSMNEIDIDNPPSNMFTDNALYALKQELGTSNNSLGGVKGRSNIFAIAKVGLPNLILPSSLDIKISNYNHYLSYIQLCDNFFPHLSTSQHSVLVLRPLIVRNGINDFLVQILKINEFTILKRKTRMLTKSEIAFLAEEEQITDDKCETYYNLMMDGQCEIIVVSKLGGVSDLKSLVDGSAPYGRRRLAQLDEGTSAVRTNVDAVNSMFEITPFTSMSEFLDLEDYIITNSKLDKYKKNSKKFDQFGQSSRINDQLYFHKLDVIRKELNLFQRHFNLIGHVPSSTAQAQKEMCVLMPEVAIIEEVIVMLNPLYGLYIESIERLLFRMGFKTLCHKVVTLTDDDTGLLFKEKIQSNIFSGASSQDPNISTSSHSGEKLAKFLNGSQVYMWHLNKISADRELRQIYKDAQVELEDILRQQVKQTPFRTNHFPFLFLFMDSDYMFEIAYKMLWGSQLSVVSGQSLIDVYDFKTRKTALEIALQVTVGDSIKELCFDSSGNLIKDPNNPDIVHSIQSRIPQIFLFYGNPKGSSAVHTVVESEKHGLYEIRFTRLPHKGDFYNLAIEPDKINFDKLKLRYFTKFQVLNYYYNEVNKYYYNVCPAFYRFKICALVPQGQIGSDMLNRVYEVEEYMGRTFIDEIASMHQEHVRMFRHQKVRTVLQIGRTITEMLLESEQKSLPPYIWGSKIAKMVMDLQKIKGSDQLTGFGKINFSNNELKGEVPKASDYYAYDKNRFLKYLEDFKLGWNFYLSALECDLLESKLRRIIDSVTFKHSRQPGYLSLIPDRMTEINLRISQKVQLLVENSLKKDNNKKFYEHLNKMTTDPNNEERTSNMVQSVMQTLYLENTRVNAEKRRFADNNGGKGFKLEDVEEMKFQKDQKNQYSVYKDCAIVGVDVARRPKYQLIASIWYLINFHLRKIDRKTELFDDLEKPLISNEDVSAGAEEVYDQILDTMITSIKDNYGRDEFNYALDIVSLNNPVKEGSDFERLVREQQELENRLKENLRNRAEEELRTQRSRMNFQELLQTLQVKDSKLEEKKQRDALKQFVETRGYMDHQGEGFLGVLKQSQQYLGPLSIKMANDHIKSIEHQKKSKQEMISFVKMEYFLYAVSEAHRCVLELKSMENRIETMEQEFEFAGAELSRIGTMTQFTTGQMKSKINTASYNTNMELFESLKQKLEKLRYQISMKETELVLIFRELMSWDYYVPEYYFDKNAMVDRKQQEQLQETYILPTRTFWRPIFFDKYREPDLLRANFARRFRDFTEDESKKKPMDPTEGSESERNYKPRTGVLISYLRPFDARHHNDYLKFDKYFSTGEFEEKKELNRIKNEIHSKLTREKVNYGERFQPHATEMNFIKSGIQSMIQKKKDSYETDLNPST